METIKQLLKKANEWKVFLLIIILVGGVFYWYEIRPAQIRSECTYKTLKANTNNYDHFYKSCLTYKGINK